MDYAALAKQFGGTATPATSGNVDYSTLAKKFGGTAAPTNPGADHPFNPNHPDYQKNVDAITKGSSQSTLLNFLQSLPAEAANRALGSATKFATSAGEGMLQTLKTGGESNAAGKTYDIPGIAPFKSFQSDALDRVKQGQNPLLNAGQAALEVGGALADTLALGEGLTAAPEAIKKVAGGARALFTSAADKVTARATQKATEEALSITKPLLDKKSSISALENAGRPGGANAALRTTASAHDLEVANSVKGIVSKTATAAENNTAINNEISRISEQEIKPFLEKNPAIFNQKTFSAYLDNKVSIPNYIKADPVLQNTYNLTKQSLMDEVAKFPKTTNGLWEARKSFDQIAEKQVGKLNPSSEKVSAVKQAILDFRRGANDFIADRTPNGDANFKAKLKDLSNKYEARTNIAENNYKLVNKGFFSRFKAQHPTATKVLKGAAKVAGVGAAIDEAGKLLH